uniref:Polycomb group heterochromatin-associated protein HP1-like protein n=1 Tax=Dugesia japonica TaxID=6161 RepID=A0A5J6BTI0_DUGJA|nr:polycomb group heterochromatin-associated protein HP1-like protein [Dugesia japonica]
MPKKRKCRLKALPERQCKKPRISISLRENRKSINYNETIEISSEDSKGKHEDEQIDDVENSSNSSVVILDNVKQGENGKPSFFESINISFHDERFPEGNTDGEELQKPEEFTASVINQETPVENGEITQNKVDIEDLNIPAEKGCGSTISLSSCDSKSTTSKRKKRNSKKQPTITEEIFYVEKILEMKYENGKRLFFLKWEGFPDSENTWEPEENLECPELIKEFLKEQRKLKCAKKRKRLLSADSLNLEELPEEVIIKEPAVKPRGFPRSREPESILAAGMMNDQMMFLIKWKNVDMANLVSARRANIECPQVVIRFYENHLNWENTSHLNLTSVPKENLANPIEDEFTKINKTISKKLNADPASTMNTLISLLDNDDENIPVRKPTNFLKIKPKPVNRKTTLPYRGRPLTKLFERKTNTETLPKTSVIGSSSNSMMDLINNFKGPRALLPHKLPVTNTVSRPLPPPTPLENLSRVYESRDIPKEQTPPPPKFELPKPNQTQLLRPINSYRPDFNPRRFGISSRPLLNASQHSQINSSQKIQMPSLTPSMTMPTLKAAPTLALIHQPNSLINFQSPSSNYDASSSINNYIDNSPIDQKNISLPNSNNNNNNNKRKENLFNLNGFYSVYNGTENRKNPIKLYEADRYSLKETETKSKNGFNFFKTITDPMKPLTDEYEKIIMDQFEINNQMSRNDIQNEEFKNCLTKWNSITLRKSEILRTLLNQSETKTVSEKLRYFNAIYYQKKYQDCLPESDIYHSTQSQQSSQSEASDNSYNIAVSDNREISGKETKHFGHGLFSTWYVKLENS